ncbi:tetratricopeptide repeat protein [Pseudoduganella aquatica]|uniref:Tetratricopeptide repeat protein n=1 Tax=Pseudoduganella aquatica TaxID=2660641 RepID=A0A7X4HAZ3_9BURK|nr:tetratricopeptide repeat protein [Pseudoduganella aquatica]MYN07908.1 tetratricopeptide repeat protein [Pseudoduganella aquatica]
MQALKKAERSKQHTLLDEETADKPSEAFDEVLALTPQDLAQDRFQPRPTEFSLEPLDETLLPEQADEQIPALTPAEEAPHDPTPPQARVGGEHAASPAAEARHKMESGTGPDHGTRSWPRSAPGAGAEAGTGTGTGAGAAARVRAAARTAADEKLGWDPARVRLAVLGGILLLVVALFGYLFWRATTSPGPGANLPMVPMPPPDAAGAKTGTIVVPPGSTLGGPVAADVPGTQPGGAGDHPAPSGAAQPQAPSTGITLATPYPRGASGQGSMLGSPRGAPPASNTVMATPEEIEQAMQMQAGQQGGSPPPFAASAHAAPPAGAGGVNGGAAGLSGMSGAGSAGANGAASAGTRPADAAWASGDIKVSRHSNAPRLSPALQNGYQALLSGDLTAAAEHYAAALRQEPNNRDALLGNAAVALRRNDAAQASASYTRLLELDPSDADALAGLLSLRPGDATQSEQRLKALLRKTPDAAPIQFALGNLYARQARWTDAQQAYFRAYTASPDNPDYAFNLAIGLDRLNQPKLALTYYQRALALSQSAPAGFDAEAVRARMRQLGAPD